MMGDFLPPFAAAMMAWFFATGAILWLDRRPEESWGASMLGATILSGFAFAVVLISAESGSVLAAYSGFVATILLWGWHELSFLMGFVTGPRREVCPADATGWRRFKLATATLIHHEIALALTALVLVLVTWGQPSQIAAWTFLLLFGMRLSTKFNIFLGVPQFSDEMLPDHLSYLRSYFRESRGNPLLPFSAIASLGVTALFGWFALQAPAGSGAQVQYQLLTALSLLGVVEHAFLLLPVRDSALWTWLVGRGGQETSPVARVIRISEGD
ncbi:MAG: putative photosynthetic complex assembly protein PuhE [Sandaracinobacter sp.]